MQIRLKKTSKIALGALLILLAGAFVFYKERVLFGDASYIAFNIINYNSFAIQEHRYGSFITQMVPYIGQKLHLPLKAILLGYSISFNLFYLLVALLLVYRYKQYGLAILMALYYFLFVSVSYFWTNNEIHQAVAWMFLFFGVIIHLGYKKANFVLLLLSFLVLSFLTIYTHFIAIIPTAFLWIYLIFQKENWPFSKNITILFSALLVAIITAKYTSAAGKQSYDSDHLRGISRLSLSDIYGSFNTPVVNMFYTRCKSNYWMSAVVFIAGITALLRNKQWMLAVWTIVSCLGYIVLMGITYGDLDSRVLLFHIETEWQCLGIIIAAPFVFALLPRLNTSLSITLLVIIFVTRLAYIGSAIPIFNWRVRFEEQMLTQMKKKGITKLALYDDLPEIREKYLLDWASGYESLFLSTMDEDQPARTFIFINKDDKQKRDLITSNHGFCGAWSIVPVNDMNSRYFKIDTDQAYHVMTYDEFFK